jgi:hypothetical protein
LKNREFEKHTQRRLLPQKISKSGELKMKNVVKNILLLVFLCVVSFGVAIDLFPNSVNQPAIASVELVAQQTAQAPVVTFVGEIDSSRSYRLTIDRSDDLVYLQCPENYEPKFGYVSNVEAIRCEPLAQ